MMPLEGILRQFMSGVSMRRRIYVLFIAALLFAGIELHPSESDQQSSPPQQNQSPVYQSSTVLRATTRLVVVDVVATDNKGEPVANLKAEDFKFATGSPLLSVATTSTTTNRVVARSTVED